MAIGKNPGPKLYFSQFGGEQPIPPEFIAAMERAEEVQSVPNDVGPEALSDTIIESSVKTDRTDERVRRTIKKKSGNIVLRAIHTNDKGQPVQVTRTLYPTGSTPTQPSATQTVAVQDLGNGWSIQEVGVEGSYIANVFTPGLFSGKTREVGTPIVIPEEFRASSGISTNTDVVAGLVADTISLGANEVHRLETQVTNFTKRVEVTVFDPDAATPLEGQDYKQQEDVVIRWQKRLEPTGTSLNDARTEINPISDTLDVAKAFDISAVAAILDAYLVEFPGTANLALPDTLLSVDVIVDNSSGDGDGTNITTGILSRSARVSAQGSASLTAKVIPRVQENTRRNVTTSRKVFYLPLPVTEQDVLDRLGSVEPWPDYRSITESIAVIGQRASAAAGVEYGRSLSPISQTTGSSQSKDFTPNTDVTIIHNTIHDEVELNFIFGSADEEATARAYVEVRGTQTFAPYYYIAASRLVEIPIALKIYPTTLAATSISEISGGSFLLDVNAAIFGYGYAIVHTEQVTL